MKREIKFRGKRIDNNEWIVGDLCTQDKIHETLIGVWIKETHPYVEWIPVYPESVGQFTGLLDKNNNEVYEGDTLLWNNEKVIVYFGEARWSVRLNGFPENLYQSRMKYMQVC